MKTLAFSNAKRLLWPTVLLGATLLLSACGGGDSTGPTGQSVALRTVPELAGANCATGGSKIEAGPDSNSNGSVDAGEVTSTAYVCNGQPGLSGAVGAAGAVGLQGLTGATGAIGPSGPAGATGTTGAIGPSGPAGATGTTGAIGPSGPAGATGTTGAIGPSGPAGTTGVAGLNGTNGTNGINGQNGANGQNSAIEVCLVPAATEASKTLCPLSEGPSTLIQAGVDLTGNGLPGTGDPLDPKGITSSVLMCGAGSPAGTTIADPFVATVRVMCAQFKGKV